MRYEIIKLDEGYAIMYETEKPKIISILSYKTDYVNYKAITFRTKEEAEEVASRIFDYNKKV